MQDRSADTTAPARPLISVRDVNLWYGRRQALVDVSFDLDRTGLLAFIGPSGCGKTTMLKCLNRMHDGTRDLYQTGLITMDGIDINDPGIDPPFYRRRFGWVAQKPNPFPASIWENVATGPRMHGLCTDAADLAAHVETCLRRAGLWDEVRDDLHHREGTDLSVGQQQRLCIARALSTSPEVLLMDEPTGSIDPIATARVEALLLDLKSRLSVVVVTHSMMQARRLADRVACFHLGRLVEIGPTEQVFTFPHSPEAQAFLSGATG